MKKLFCMFIALLIMFSCAGAEMIDVAGEGAETGTADDREADLLDIWQTDGERKSWITAAVQLMDGMLLTSPALLPERTEGLMVTDGQSEWQVKAVIPDSTGVMAMVFFNAEKVLPRYAAWPLMAFGDSAKATACFVRSGNEDGGRTDSPVRSAASLEWQNCRCLLLDLEGEMHPGAVVLNEKEELAGVVVAEYAEGQRRVLALPVEEIVRGMSEAGTILKNLFSWGEPQEGFRVMAKKNLVEFDWSAVTLPEKKEGEDLYLVVADNRNNYLNFFPAETSDRKLQMILAPGRVYISGILASAEIPADYPEHYEVTVIPPAKRLTDHRFRPTLTAIAMMPENAEKEQEPDPVTEVTEEMLRSGRAYFYSASSYEVNEKIEGESLLVTLTDPAGNCYRYESSWVYAPEYMKEDTWYISLTEAGLLFSLDKNGYPLGTYQLAYYVNGDLADTVTFELK